MLSVNLFYFYTNNNKSNLLSCNFYFLSACNSCLLSSCNSCLNSVIYFFFFNKVVPLLLLNQENKAYCSNKTTSQIQFRISFIQTWFMICLTVVLTKPCVTLLAILPIWWICQLENEFKTMRISSTICLIYSNCNLLKSQIFCFKKEKRNHRFNQLDRITF
jgi:hypothetical protein